MAAVISTGSSLCVLASALSTHRVFSGFYSYTNPSTNHVGIKSHKTQQQSHRREEREGRRKEILTPRRQKKGKGDGGRSCSGRRKEVWKVVSEEGGQGAGDGMVEEEKVDLKREGTGEGERKGSWFHSHSKGRGNPQVIFTRPRSVFVSLLFDHVLLCAADEYVLRALLPLWNSSVFVNYIWYARSKLLWWT